MSKHLRITGVERYVLKVPFTPRCEEWNALLVWKWGIIEVIRLLTNDSELVGVGETVLHYTWARVPDDVDVRLVGRNPFDLLGDDSLGAGVQMALYDLAGKAVGVPVYRLFNMPVARDWCPIAWWNTKMPPAALAEEAKLAVSNGYTAHKIKARPWFDVFEQVNAISSVTPSHYKIDLDWNEMLLTADNAVGVLSVLEQQDRVAIFESPIFHHDVDGQQALRQKLRRPLAIHFGTPSFPTAMRQQVCDGFVIGGGVQNALKHGTLAAEFEKPFWLQLVGTGLTTALTAHLGAVLPFARWPAITALNNYSDDLIVEALTISAGMVRVPQAPGLGVTLDEQALTRYRLQPPYDLPEPRHLLTVTWASGLMVHFASMARQCWPDFRAGKYPVQEPGVSLTVRPDDGSPEWRDLYARAARSPVSDIKGST
jgi:L-alanine-DL-glutamate epimerase-like enolase superfamily enzyme